MTDLSLTHSLNAFALHHDALADPLELYVRGSEALFAGLLVVLLLIGGRSGWQRPAALVAGASAALALVIGVVIAQIVDRSRPFVDHAASVHRLIPHAADSGFPSDHATASFAIATALLLRHRGLGLVALAGAALLSVGRVVLGVHYPTDVLAGAALGAASAFAVARVAGRVPAVGGLRLTET